jgi:hypothetical protein
MRKYGDQVACAVQCMFLDLHYVYYFIFPSNHGKYVI